MLIGLTQGQETIVDQELFGNLSGFNWYAHWNKNTKSFYARRSSKIAGKSKAIQMHREIMNAPVGVVVDHINGNTLDNRIANLRFVTVRQNNQNRHNEKSSIYPGVYRHKNHSKWVARISIMGKNIHLGCHKNEIDAFSAYVSACINHGLPVDQMLERFMVPE
ncbi:MAG TPA: HNH endonuclease signature motif containing protein [Alphaproteobacteria bacterium]|nr:HNH endonuclease signature motif containing protein [Alphaproteobacteria bacterium]